MRLGCESRVFEGGAHHPWWSCATPAMVDAGGERQRMLG